MSVSVAASPDDRSDYGSNLIALTWVPSALCDFGASWIVTRLHNDARSIGSCINSSPIGAKPWVMTRGRFEWLMCSAH